MIPSINNLEDLAASEDVGVLVLDNNVIGQQIMVIKIRFLVIVTDFKKDIFFLFIVSNILNRTLNRER